MFKKTIIKKISFCLLFSFLVMNSENFYNTQIFYERNDVKKINKKNDQLALMSGLQTGELKHEVLEMVYKNLNKVYKEQGLKKNKLDEAIQEFYKYLEKVSGIKIDMSEVNMHEDTLEKIRVIKIQYNGKKYEHKIVLNYREINIHSDVCVMRGFPLSKDILVCIFEILPISSFLNCMRACRALRDLLKTNRILKSKCIEWCKKNNRDETYLDILIERYEGDWYSLSKTIVGKKQYIPITQTRYKELCSRETKNDVDKGIDDFDVWAYDLINNDVDKEIHAFDMREYDFSNSGLFYDNDYKKKIILENFRKITFKEQKNYNYMLNILKELFKNNSTTDSIKAEIIKMIISNNNVYDLPFSEYTSEYTIQVLAELLLNDNLNNMFFNAQDENLQINIIKALQFICNHADASNMIFYQQALIKLEEFFKNKNTKDIYKTNIIDILNNMYQSNKNIQLFRQIMQKLIELLLNDDLNNIFFNTQNENLQAKIIEGLIIISEYSDIALRQKAISKLSEILLNNNINGIFDKAKHKFMNINQLLVGIIDDKPSLKEDIILGLSVICLYPNISILTGCKAIIKLVELSKFESTTTDLRGKIKGVLLTISKSSCISKLLSECAVEEGRDELTQFVQDKGHNKDLFIKEKKNEMKNKYESLKIPKNITEYPVILDRIWNDVEQIALSLRQDPVECMNEFFPKLIEIIYSMQKQVDSIAESECLNNELFLSYRPKIDLIRKTIKQKIKKERLIMLCDGIIIYCVTISNGKEIKKIISKSSEYYMPVNNIRKIHGLVFAVLQEIFYGKINVKLCVRIQDIIFKIMPKKYYRAFLNYEGMKNIVTAS
jgi:hypothetical protein